MNRVIWGVASARGHTHTAADLKGHVRQVRHDWQQPLHFLFGSSFCLFCFLKNSRSDISRAQSVTTLNFRPIAWSPAVGGGAYSPVRGFHWLVRTGSVSRIRHADSAHVTCTGEKCSDKKGVKLDYIVCHNYSHKMCKQHPELRVLTIIIVMNSEEKKIREGRISGTPTKHRESWCHVELLPLNVT